MLYAKIVVGTALIYAEEHLLTVYGGIERIQPLLLGNAAFEPAGGALTAFLGVVVFGGVFDAFIERHSDS